MQFVIRAEKELVDKILNNRFYQHMSNYFAGSQEFIAIGKVYGLLSEGKYDKIVVDTAPSKHAVDFLEMLQELKLQNLLLVTGRIHHPG